MIDQREQLIATIKETVATLPTQILQGYVDDLAVDVELAGQYFSDLADLGGTFADQLILCNVSVPYELNQIIAARSVQATLEPNKGVLGTQGAQ
jgi:hypothetical protein